MATIDREKLINALVCVKPGLSNKELIEQSTSFVFKSNRVWTYNDMIAISCPIDLGGLEGSAPADEFYKLITKMKEGKIEISADSNSLVVKGGKSQSTFKQGEGQLPMLQIDSDVASWSPLPITFVDSLKFCLFSVSTDLTRLELTSIHLKDSMIESCDNFRLTQSTLKEKIFQSGVLLPGSSAKELVKYTPEKFHISDGWVHFSLKSGAIVSCRTYEGEFPDTSFILEMEDGEKIVFPTNMNEMLGRASVLAELDLTGERLVAVEIQNGEIVVRAKGPSGEYEERSRTRVSGHYKFECNIQFLQEILGHLRIAEVAKDGSKLRFIGNSFIHVLSLMGIE